MASRPATTSASLAALKKKPALVANAGEPGLPLAIANAVAMDSEAYRHRRQAPAELDKRLVALAPAGDHLEFFDDAALGSDDVARQDRGLLTDHGALQIYEADRARVELDHAQAWPST